MADRFLIAPYDKSSGLQTNVKNWLIPDQAFSTLNNAYVWRGRVRKRFGSRWITNSQLGTRLRVALATSVAIAGGVGVGITDGVGNATGVAPGGVYAVGQSFTIGTARYLVTSALAGAQTMSATVTTPTATFNTGTGAFVFAGAPINTQIYFYNGTSATTDGAGDVTVLVPGNTYAIGQAFSIGDQVFTVNALGTPADMLKTGAATLARFNTTTGLVEITGADFNTAIYYYPSLPVMGLLTMEAQSHMNEPTIAFDTRFAYQYIGDGWERLANENAAGDAVWTGDDSQLFYGVTWVGDNGANKIFFVTNFNESEPNFMRYLDTGVWNSYAPLITATEHLFCARILIVFHNHLLALNTWEGTDVIANNVNYQNRVRWAWTFSPLHAEAWRQDIPGRGSGLDAATTEAIIGAEFVQDRLIVYFERSTWELVFTGNPVQPFTWQQINTELGCESTFSVVPFDKMALGIGSVGVHSCNGIGVDRIDTLIPELIIDISNASEGAQRVYGIRDYKAEMVYWAYPDDSTTSTTPYPNRILLYNYVNGTWATNDDVLTAFGYFQQKTGISWNSTTVLWNSATSWNSAGNANIERIIVAGNQQGWTYIIDQDLTYNAPTLQITDISVTGDFVILTVINHSLRGNTYIFLQNITGSGTMDTLNEEIYQILTVTQNTIQIFKQGVTGSYTGFGTIAVVNNMNIVTKEYSFYIDKGGNSAVNKVDFQVKRTDAGQVSIQMRTSSSTVNLTSGAQTSGALIGAGTLVTSPYALYPYESTAERVIHPFYTSVSGSFVQMTITLSPDQLKNVNVMRSDFQMHSMLIYASPVSRMQ